MSAVILHGPPGSPVSEVANELGRRWDVPVRETDHEVERRLGAGVAEIFVTAGEAAFRAGEADVVRAELADLEHGDVLAQGRVLVLGSGVAAQPELAELIAAQDVPVIFLDVTLTDAARRLGFNAGPPGLGSPRSSWQKMMTERRAAYEAVSTHRVQIIADDLAATADAVESAVGRPPTSLDTVKDSIGAEGE